MAGESDSIVNDVIGEYYVGGIDGSGTGGVEATPEPASVVLLAAGVAALGWARRRGRWSARPSAEVTAIGPHLSC